MKPISTQCGKSIYFYNDGILSRYFPLEKRFETYQIRDRVWAPTRDSHLIQKMQMGKGQIVEEDSKKLLEVFHSSFPRQVD